MTLKDQKILSEMIDELKSIQHTLKQMRTTGIENKPMCSLMDSLKNTIYHTQDLKGTLGEQEHWNTIMKFQKEVHRL